MACNLCQQLGSAAGMPQGLAGMGPWQCQHELHAMGVPGYESIPHTISMTRQELQDQLDSNSKLIVRLTEALKKSEAEKGDLLAAAKTAADILSEQCVGDDAYSELIDAIQSVENNS